MDAVYAYRVAELSDDGWGCAVDHSFYEQVRMKIDKGCPIKCLVVCDWLKV